MGAAPVVREIERPPIARKERDREKKRNGPIAEKKIPRGKTHRFRFLRGGNKNLQPYRDNQMREREPRGRAVVKDLFNIVGAYTQERRMKERWTLLTAKQRRRELY